MILQTSLLTEKYLLNCKFYNYNQKVISEEIGLNIIKIIKNIQKGIIVFFHSYSEINTIVSFSNYV